MPRGDREHERRGLLAEALSGVGGRLREMNPFGEGWRPFGIGAGWRPQDVFLESPLGRLLGLGQTRDFSGASADMARRMDALLNPPSFSEESAELARRGQEILDRGRSGVSVSAPAPGPGDARTAFSGTNPFGYNPAGVSWLGMDVRGAVAGPRGEFRPRVHTK